MKEKGYKVEYKGDLYTFYGEESFLAGMTALMRIPNLWLMEHYERYYSNNHINIHDNKVLKIYFENEKFFEFVGEIEIDSLKNEWVSLNFDKKLGFTDYQVKWDRESGELSVEWTYVDFPKTETFYLVKSSNGEYLLDKSFNPDIHFNKTQEDENVG